MEFKYFKDYQSLASFSEAPEVCDICERSTVCLGGPYYGSEEIGYICPQCLFEGKLFGRDVFTNSADKGALTAQLKEKFAGLPEAEIASRVNALTRELEQGTPHLVTWQDMEWPCLDGDYARFIGFGSKPFFKTLAPHGDGKALYERSLHEDLVENYDEEDWEERVPDKMIWDLKGSNQYSVVFYVFQSLYSDRLVVLWDCD